MLFMRLNHNRIAILALSFFWHLPSFGRIILLNGTSSAGKSSVVSEFVRLNPDYKALSIDTFKLELFTSEALKLKIIKRPEELKYVEQIGDFIKLQPAVRRTELYAHFNQIIDHITELFYDHIVSYARINQNIIIDDVIILNSELQNVFTKLEPYDVTMILAYCPFNTLPARVTKRNKTGNKAEYRTLDSVLSQFSYIYTPTKKKRGIVKIAYKTFNHTINLASSFIKSQEEFMQFKNEMDRQLIQNRKLQNTTHLHLKPRLKYDHIINTGKSDPTKSAISISAYIARHEFPKSFARNMKKFLRFSLSKSIIEHTAITSENYEFARKALTSADYTPKEINLLLKQPNTRCIQIVNKYKKVLAIIVVSPNEVIGIYVHPYLRRLGIGSELIAEAKSTTGKSKLTTSFSQKNVAVENFFKKNEFIKIDAQNGIAIWQYN